MVQPHQLPLFKAKRLRPPPPKEFLLHVALAKAVRMSLISGWMWSHLPFGERRDAVTAGRLKAMGVNGGLPDFMFVGPRGFAFIELKRPGGRLSDEQTAWMRQLAMAGAMYLCTDDVEDALSFLRDLGIVRARVSA